MRWLSDNNFYFDLPLNFPLKKMAVGAVEPVGERMRLGTPVVYKDSLLCPIIDSLKCLELDSLRLKWGLVGAVARVLVNEDYIYTAVDHQVVCVDPSTAEIQWRTEDEEHLHNIYKDHVYTTSKQEPYPVRCRDKTTGELIWEMEIDDSEELYFSENIFIARGKTFHGVDCESGKILWRFNKKEWIDQNILSLDLDYPESYSDFEKQMMRIGPLVSGTLYLMPKVGGIAAIDAPSGKLKGTVVIPTGKIEMPYNSREILNLVYRDGTLYFHRGGFQQKSSVIIGALDVDSGDVLFTKEHFHPATGGQPGAAIMVGRYYIAPFQANYLVVFDTERQEFTWIYETTGQEIGMLSNMPVPYENGLIFSDQQQYVHRFQGQS